MLLHTCTCMYMYMRTYRYMHTICLYVYVYVYASVNVLALRYMYTYLEIDEGNLQQRVYAQMTFWQRSYCHRGAGHTDQEQSTHMSRELRSIGRFSFDALAFACDTFRLVSSLRFQIQGREQKALGHHLGFFPRLDLRVDGISRNWLLSKVSPST